MRQLLRTLLPSLAGPLAILLLVATFLSTPIARYDEHFAYKNQRHNSGKLSARIPTLDAAIFDIF
jgi:hypothetical protein